MVLILIIILCTIFPHEFIKTVAFLMAVLYKIIVLLLNDPEWTLYIKEIFKEFLLFIGWVYMCYYETVELILSYELILDFSYNFDLLIY